MKTIEELVNDIQPVHSGEKFHALLATKINDLITNDLPALVQLLYRLDIAEKKLKVLTVDRQH